VRIHRSRIEVLTILMHLDVHGIDETCKRYRVDKRTLARWQTAEPSGWEREEELNRLRMAEAHIEGKVKYRDAAVGRGIAWDKLWRIARRKEAEQRRQGEAELEQPKADPIYEAVMTLSDDRQRLMRDMIDLEIQTRNGDEHLQSVAAPMSEDEGDAAMLAWVAELAAASDEEVAAESERIHAELRRIQEERVAESQAARQEQRQQQAPPPAPDAPEGAPEPPKPALRAADDHDHPSWQPFRRYEL
jgi:DNA segregation ATPase FtsK/SpoIIIE-like protein